MLVVFKEASIASYRPCQSDSYFVDSPNGKFTAPPTASFPTAPATKMFGIGVGSAGLCPSPPVIGTAKLREPGVAAADPRFRRSARGTSRCAPPDRRQSAFPDESKTIFGNPAGLKKTVPSSSAATALPEPTRPWPLTLCWLMKKPVAERRDESMRTSTTVAALDMAVPTAREGEVRVIH